MFAGDFLTMSMTFSHNDCVESVQSLQTNVFAEHNSQEYGNGGGKVRLLESKCLHEFEGQRDRDLCAKQSRDMWLRRH